MVSESRVAKTPRQLRDEVEQLIRDDLIGPLGGAEEELLEPPVDRYLLGLARPALRVDRPPRSQRRGVRQRRGRGGSDRGGRAARRRAGAAGTADSGEEGTAEDRPPAVDQLVPSAFGLTFAVDADCSELARRRVVGRVRAAHERREARPRRQPARVWRRRACGGELRVAVGQAGAIGPFVAGPRRSRRWSCAASCATATGIASSRCFSSTRRCPTAAARSTAGCARRSSTCAAAGRLSGLRAPPDRRGQPRARGRPQ